MKLSIIRIRKEKPKKEKNPKELPKDDPNGNPTCTVCKRIGLLIGTKCSLHQDPMSACKTRGCGRATHKMDLCHYCHGRQWEARAKENQQEHRLSLLRVVAPPRAPYIPKRKAIPNFVPHDDLFDPREGLPIRTVNKEDMKSHGSTFVPGCS